MRKPWTLSKLVELANSLDTEQRHAAEKGLSDEELALFDRVMREAQQSGSRASEKGQPQLGGFDPKWNRSQS